MDVCSTFSYFEQLQNKIKKQQIEHIPYILLPSLVFSLALAEVLRLQLL